MSKTDSSYDDREQSEIKHLALRLYLEAATRIIGSAWNFKYVDCCAGPWENAAADYHDTSFGIAVATLRCDFTTKLSEVGAYCSKPKTFPFIFIDPTGWQLAGISKVWSLLKLNPGEVLINLMSSFITRFIKDNKTDFSDLLGVDYPSLRTLSGAELELAIVDKYCELIKQEGGYEYVCALPVMKPNSDSFHFHLIYATRHRKGVKVFKEVEKRTEDATHQIRAELQQEGRQSKSGNLELYEPGVLYRESRYQQHARTNQDRAKEAVRVLIESKKQISYDECWGEALQFSSVYEKHLRDWITDWEKQGLVVVKGKPPRSRVLQVEKGIVLSWNAEIRIPHC